MRAGRRRRSLRMLAGIGAADGRRTLDARCCLLADGQHMLVSVGSGSNVDDADTHEREFHRADVLEFTPEGKFVEVYAHGLRNCVGEAINPTTGELWCSTNERDNLGNHLVPDYVTSRAGGQLLRLAVVLHGRTSGPASAAALREWHGAESADDGAAERGARRRAASAWICRPRCGRRMCWCSRTWLRWSWRSIRRQKTQFPAEFAAGVRGGAWLVESREPRRVRGHLRPDAGRPCDGRV